MLAGACPQRSHSPLAKAAGILQWYHESCVKAGILLVLWGDTGECAWVTLVGRETVREEVASWWSFKSDRPYP